MSCHGGTHHACECQMALLNDLTDSMAHLLAGLERYRKRLSIYDRGHLTETVPGIKEAQSVLNRARRSNTF